MREETLKDEQIRQLLGVLRSGWPRAGMPYPWLCNHFGIIGSYSRRLRGCYCVALMMVIPRSMRPEMLQRARDDIWTWLRPRHVSGK